MIIQNVLDVFTQPLLASLKNNPFSRKCTEIPDDLFISLGLQRVMGEDRSGRGYLERIMNEDVATIDTSHFFKSLISKRRLNHLKLTNKDIAKLTKLMRTQKDYFAQFKELSDFDLNACDGSYHEWACHDECFEKKTISTDLKAVRNENHKKTKRSVQHFSAIDLRTSVASHLTVALIGGERQKEHDLHALKRLTPDELRLNAPKGRKVCLVYDRACIDYIQWEKWKQNNGIYILTREKENSRLQIVGMPPFNKKDPINIGVISDEMVGTGNGSAFRRVKYKCPETEIEFSFLTTLPFSIRPGLIVLLYKARWEIEKLFDTFKNKLEETKAWASSDTAKTMQVEFMCLTHNLTLLINDKIEQEEKVEYKYDLERKTENLKIKQAALDQKNIPYPSTWELSLHVSQMPVKFYRWIRVHFQQKTPWPEAIEKLRIIYESY